MVVWLYCSAPLPATARRLPAGLPHGSAATPADPVSAEAERLFLAARAAHATPHGPIELWRMNRLAGWLPRAVHDERLRQAATDEKATPLYRAMAWWLMRERAERRLDGPAVREAAKALGLLDGFALRPGPAPGQSTAPLDPQGFRPYPAGAGGGELWLEAFVRPAQEATATLVTRVTAPGGPAVLRFGYDDAITVWLNGDEIHRSEKEHPAWLDQVAIPVVLRPGDNRLVVEVRQRSGAWRVLCRLTDPRGAPLAGVSAHPDPWGPVPEPSAEAAPATDAVESLYPQLLVAQSSEPPDARGLRALADYAQAAALPDADRLLPRVAVESAWEADPGPRSLRAWLELLPEAERAPVRTSHRAARPLRAEDVHADLALRLDEAWAHFHGRRFVACLEILDHLTREAPDFRPALKLRAAVLEEMDLPNQAVSLLEAQGAPTGPASLRSAWRDALRAAGRTEAHFAALKAEVGSGEATADEVYQLATGLRARGDLAGALVLLDRLGAARPELWGYLMEGIDIELFEGHREAARARLEKLLALAPDEPGLLERLARMQVAAGETSAAVTTLDHALAIDPGRVDVQRYRDALSRVEKRTPLGPPLESLLPVEAPPGAAAHVLYHHARAVIAPTGLAVREVRRVVRILSPEGARQFGTWELAYTPGTQRLEVDVARLIRPGEPPQSPRRSDRDLSAPAWRLYYDLRAEVLSFPRVVPGDVIEVSWRVADLDPDPSFPGYFGELAYLQESAPRAVSIVEFDSALPLTSRVEGHGLTVTKLAPLRFEALAVPGLAPETFDPGLSSQRAYVHVSTLEGWSDASRRYGRLLAGRDAPDERLAARARTLIGDARTPEEKIRLLYHAVASGVRYVGLELGTHSFRPESPHVTLARAYGDCKDKATLLIALLRAVDVDANLTLVRTRPQGNVAEQPASFAVFDHALIYLPGLDRFVDPTQDRNDPFALPPPDQGASAFVVGVDTRLRQIPYSDPAASGESWALHLTLPPDGRLRGTAAWTLRADFATTGRQLMEAEAARRDEVQRALAGRFPGVEAGPVTLTGLRPADDPLMARADVVLPPLVREGTGWRLARAGLPWRLVDTFAHAGARKVALQPGAPRVIAFDLEVDLPAGWVASLPADVDFTSDFGTFRTESRQDAGSPGAGGRLKMTTRWRLSATEISPAAYPAFRDWLSRIDTVLEDFARLAPTGRRGHP